MKSEKLLLLGFDESIRGARYMDAALEIIGEGNNRIWMKDLYIELASRFLTTTDNILSGIRYAIQKWWSTAPEDMKKKYFRRNYNLNTPPTNKAFIYHIVSTNVNAFKE